MAKGGSDLGMGTVSDPGWTAKTTYKGKKIDYSYFAAGMGVVSGQANDWPTNNLSYKPTGGRTFTIREEIRR